MITVLATVTQSTDVLPLVAGVLAGCAIVAFAAFFMGHQHPDEDVYGRLSRFSGEAYTAELNAAQVATVNPIKALFTWFNGVLARSARTSRLTDSLSRADLKIKPAEWLSLVLFFSALVGIIFSLRIDSWIPFPLALLMGYFISHYYLKFRQGRRSRAFNRQLGDTMMLLSNALRAGYAFSQAIATVSRSSSPPISEEFARASREIALGIPVDDALQHMVDRNHSEDFDLMVTAVQIQRVVGGNLAEILDTIAFTIRERVRIEGEIRTLTAQARTSGYIITALPIGLAVLLEFIEPSYFGPMLRETWGHVMIALSVFSMLVGYGIITRIVKIEV